MIKNIVFDIGNVLIGFDPKKYLTALFGKEKAVRISEAVFGSGYWPELDIARLSEERILGLFYSAAPDLHDEIKEAFDRIGECVEKCEWVTPFIDSLKQRGYGVYFLSNMSEHVKASNTEAFAFTSHMNGGIWSCDVHLIKPDPEIYRALFDTYGLVPEECLFIDDRKKNTDAAELVGMKGLVLDGREGIDSGIILKEAKKY